MSMQPAGWWNKRRNEEGNNNPRDVLHAIADVNEVVGDVVELVKSEAEATAQAIADLGSALQAAIQQLATDQLTALQQLVLDQQSAFQQLSDKMDAGFAALQAVIVGPPVIASAASQLVTTITTPTGTVQGGQHAMPVNITVDDTGAHADYTWADDKGNPTAAPVDAAGAAFVVTMTSDNPAAATLAADPTTPTRANITEVALGSFNVTTTVVDSTGAAGVWPAGSPGALAGTPITDPPVAANVVAGPAGALTTTASA